MRFGLHCSIAGGIWKAAERAHALGCDCFQLFVSNPRSWSFREMPDEEISRFRERVSALNLHPVISHMTYLPNLATPFASHWKRAVDAFAEQLRRAAALGVDYMVLHPGSSRGGSHRTAVRRVAKALRQGVESVPGAPEILLENTTGSGSTIGTHPEELAEISELAGLDQRVNVCLDTAHALSAGTDVAGAEAMGLLRRRYQRAFGRAPIRVMHLNDLRADPGSGRDLHEHIGRGAIGLEGFRNILRTSGVGRLPCILETPVDDEGDDARNLQQIRSLLGEVTAEG